MFKQFFRSTTMFPHNFRWRGLVKSLLGLLGIWMAIVGVSQAKASPVTPEQAVLERRVELVRKALDVRCHETRHDQDDTGNLGLVAQWPNWANWGNWGNWPNWRNY